MLGRLTFNRCVALGGGTTHGQLGYTNWTFDLLTIGYQIRAYR